MASASVPWSHVLRAWAAGEGSRVLAPCHGGWRAASNSHNTREQNASKGRQASDADCAAAAVRMVPGVAPPTGPGPHEAAGRPVAVA